MREDYRYTVAKLWCIREYLESDFIQFTTSKGSYLYEEADLFSIAEYRADYLTAKKAVGNNLRLIRDWLNGERE